jgi:hypothetical protein
VVRLRGQRHADFVEPLDPLQPVLHGKTSSARFSMR